MIKGITVKLFERKKTGIDEFNHAIYEESPVTVSNILVSPASSQEIIDTINLTGRKAVYSIAIPKGDKHTWDGCRVDFFGSSWRVVGFPQEGIPELVPLAWNQKWMVERYE